ncbi:MAG: MoxR family ATPase [Myxococcota bacterium]|nr:MoxR family ATPase [Myxococcota bacterium]
MTSSDTPGAEVTTGVDQAAIERATSALRKIREEISKVYIGSHATVDLLLIAALARGHVLLEGVPGIAKTTLVKAFTRTLGCDFSRVQFTPDLLPADITGTTIIDLQTNTFHLRKGPLFAHVVLGDEINRAPAKTQSALLEAMQECQVTIDGQTEPLPQPFMVLATQNPVEQEGVYVLPEAQVDRFLIKVVLPYPTFEEERRILDTYNEDVEDVGPVLGPEAVLQLCTDAEAVFISKELLGYIVRLAQATREHPAVLLGASPRASLALMRCAKARALVNGRAHVLPDDVRSLAEAILSHRVILTPEAELDRAHPGQVILECVGNTPYTADAET